MSEIRKIQLEELRILKSLRDILDARHLRYYLFWGTLLGAARNQGFIPWDDDIDIVMPRADYEKLIALPEAAFPAPFKLLERRRCAGGYYELFAKYVDTSLPIKLLEPQRELRSDNFLWIDIFPLEGLPDDPSEIKRLRKKLFPLKKIYRFTTKDWNFPGRPLKNLCFRAANLVFSKSALYRKFLKLVTPYPFDGAKDVALAYKMNGDFYVYPADVFGKGREMLFEDSFFTVPEQAEKALELQFGDWKTPPPEDQRESHVFVLEERRA